MFKWFSNCKTAEEGKKLYHDLVKKNRGIYTDTVMYLVDVKEWK